jgi:hypothetical protein
MSLRIPPRRILLFSLVLSAGSGLLQAQDNQDWAGTYHPEVTREQVAERTGKSTGAEQEKLYSQIKARLDGVYILLLPDKSFKARLPNRELAGTVVVGAMDSQGFLLLTLKPAEKPHQQPESPLAVAYKEGSLTVRNSMFPLRLVKEGD